MATVLEKKDPAAKYGSQVDEQIAEATSRIRTHDLAFGGLILAAMVLVYATAMIALDKYLVLPEWVRQLSLVGFLAGFGAVAYWTIARPLTRRINPLYAAVQVEKTVEDAKNSVVGYVDAQEREDVHPTVRAAMSAKAAKAAAMADVNRAVDHRSLVYAGGVVVAFLLALIVLFFVFRPAQFGSLLGRAFVPFSADPIATRTRLTLTQPADGDVTITAGQSVTIRVQVAGKVPAPEKPDRVRVLLRRNAADPNYEELPMEKGENSRDWLVRVPDYLIQNGFWYKVAGGDAETPEYRVTVRSLPLFKDEYEVTYEYPAYIRQKPETSKDAHLQAIRGTKVTVLAKTNRTVKDGRATFEPPGREPVAGKLVPDRPDSVAFEFVLTDSGGYRLHFTSSEGERIVDPPLFSIKVIADLAPTVEIVKPEEDDIQVPANGLLAVDGTVGDDFGIDRVTLKIRLIDSTSGTAVVRQLPDVPFQGGKSFRREKDDTWPTSLEYKDSVDFAKLVEADGVTKIALREGMVLEYWLEAADNRTKPGAKGPEPDPNVGKSKVKRVHITPPKMDPTEQKTQDANKEQRKADETQHNQTQQKRLDTENRDKTPPKKDDQPQPKEPDKKDGDPKMPPEPMPGGMGDPGMKTPPDKKMDTPPTPPDAKMGDPSMPMTKQDNPPMGGMNPDPKMGMGGTDNKTETAPMPSTPESKKTQNDADRVKNEIEKDNQSGGSAKNNPTPNDDARANPADPKPMAGMGMEPPDSPPKPEPKAGDMMNPMAGGNPSESKSQGNVQQPPDPSAPKPEPKEGDPTNPMNKGGTPPAEGNKPEPLGGSPGTDKTTPEPKKEPGGMPPPMPDPTQPNKTEDPSGAGAGKPSTEKKMDGGGMPQTMPDPSQPQDPSAGAARQKPMTPPDRGGDKEPPADTKPNPMPSAPDKPQDAGDAKPMTTPQSGTGKPAPKDEKPMPGTERSAPKPAPQDGMGDPMNPKPGDPSEVKPDGMTQPMPGGPKPMDPGMDKPPPDPNATPMGGAGGPKIDPKGGGDPKTEKGPKGGAGDPKVDKGPNGMGDPKKDQGSKGDPKIDPKELDQAIQDLKSDDKTKRDAARDKLDKTVGKEARKDIEEAVGDATSDDPKAKAAGEKKLDDIKNQMAGKGSDPKKDNNATANQPKIDPKKVEELKNAVNDLASKDPAKQQAARDKLDKDLGPEARKDIEQTINDLQSGDPKRQQAAQEKIKDWMKKAEDFAKNNPDLKGKELTQEEINELMKKANDLNSKDDTKRQAAEQAFDEKIGKENREKLQEAMKNANDPGNPQTPEDIKKKIDEMAKQARSGGKDPEGNKLPNAPGSPDTKVNPAMEADPKNRLKAAELQLEQFEKNKGNQELLDRLGWTPENYDEFLKNYQAEVDRLRKEAELADKGTPPDTAPLPTPKNDYGGVGKVEPRGSGATGPAGIGGVALPPPGFGGAVEKFNQGASKVQPKK